MVLPSLVYRHLKGIIFYLNSSKCLDLCRDECMLMHDAEDEINCLFRSIIMRFRPGERNVVGFCYYGRMKALFDVIVNVCYHSVTSLQTLFCAT